MMEWRKQWYQYLRHGVAMNRADKLVTFLDLFLCGLGENDGMTKKQWSIPPTRGCYEQSRQAPDFLRHPCASLLALSAPLEGVQPLKQPEDIIRYDHISGDLKSKRYQNWKFQEFQDGTKNCGSVLLVSNNLKCQSSMAYFHFFKSVPKLGRQMSEKGRWKVLKHNLQSDGKQGPHNKTIRLKTQVSARLMTNLFCDWIWSKTIVSFARVLPSVVPE